MIRVLALLSLLFASSAGAQTSGMDRLDMRDELLGWEAVGRIDLHGKGFCTGTLIATDLVLTAAHCVYDGSGKVIEPQRITFRAGYRDGASIAERSVLRVAAHDGYKPNAGITPDNVRHDVALLKLAQPIRSVDAAPFLVEQGRTTGQSVSVVSYGRGRAEALSRQRRCNVLAQQRGLLALDCDVTYGSSGAPVFSTKGRGRIVSVISGMGQVDGKKIAYGMELPNLVATLKSTLRAGPVRSAPGAKRVRVGSSIASGGGAKFVRP